MSTQRTQTPNMRSDHLSRAAALDSLENTIGAFPSLGGARRMGEVCPIPVAWRTSPALVLSVHVKSLPAHAVRSLTAFQLSRNVGLGFSECQIAGLLEGRRKGLRRVGSCTSPW